MEVAANCSLRVKRPLLDPRFEGYKLSLEPLPSYQLELDAGGKRRCPLALCPFLFSDAIGPTLPAFSSFLTPASKATEAFLTASRAGVDIGWRSLEDSDPGTRREPPSLGSYVAGPSRAGPLLDRRAAVSGTRVVLGLWPLVRPWRGPCSGESSELAFPLGILCKRVMLRSHTSLEDPQLPFPLAETVFKTETWWQFRAFSITWVLSD